MTEPTSARVSGHTLRHEGQAFNERGVRDGTANGYGRCSCGAQSPWLTSDYQRKDWHRRHKSEVLAEREQQGRAS